MRGDLGVSSRFLVLRAGQLEAYAAVPSFVPPPNSTEWYRVLVERTEAHAHVALVAFSSNSGLPI